MSITLIQRPQTLTPAGNPMRFLVESTNIAQDSFRYVAMIAGEELKSDMLPGNNYGLFDVSRAVQTLIVPTKPDVNQATFVNLSDTNASYTVDFYDEFTSGTTRVQSFVTGVTGTAFAGNLSTLDFRNYASGTYRFASGVTGTPKYLTNMPRTGNKLRPGEMFFVDLYASLSGISGLRFQLSGFNGTDTITPTGGITSEFFRFGISYSQIEDLTDVDFVSNPWQIRFGVAYGSGVVYGDWINFVGSTCSKYNPQRVFFRNRLSGVDGYTFMMKNRQSLNVQKTTYGQATDEFATETFEAVAGGQYQNLWQLASDWVTDAESTWLAEMITSKQVWLVIGGQLVEAVVDVNSYQIVTRSVDRLQQLNVNLRVAYLNEIR